MTKWILECSCKIRSMSSSVACSSSSLKSLRDPLPQLDQRLFQKVVKRDRQQNHQRREQGKPGSAGKNVVEPIECEPDAEEMDQVDAV